MPAADEPVPVTLLAGFLGSGKTTLLNRILSEEHGEEIAVIVNEFGDVGVDGRLVVGAEEEVVELANGCICCTVRGDLADGIAKLLERRGRRFGLGRRARFERILIEASGLASPGPALQTLMIDDRLRGRVRPDGVVTLAHALHVARQLEENPEAAEQVGYADVILLNHADQASVEELAHAEERLRSANAEARIERTVRADVAVASLFGLARTETDVRAVGAQTVDGDLHANHTCGVTTVALTTDEALDLHQLKLWLQFLAKRKTHELMRVKGILRCTGHGPPVVVQAVYQWLELGPGEGAAPERSTLVLIGRDLDRDEIERGWAACRS